MKFCTAINCMDGRVQLPVIHYLRQRFNVKFVDSITEAGPNLILATRRNALLVDGILERLTISIDMHDSVGIAIVGHHGCAGNPASDDEQLTHIQDSVRFLRGRYAGVTVIGLWVNKYWEVHEVGDDKT